MKFGFLRDRLKSMNFKLQAKTVNDGMVVKKDIKVTVACYKTTEMKPKYLEPEVSKEDIRY